MIHSIRKIQSFRKREESGPENLAERLVTVANPSSVHSEAYRTLRANLLYAFVSNPPKVILLTSPGPGEGKSTTCANLGVVLAQAGKNTLILDCDFRRPAIHKFFELPNRPGVINVLVGENSLEEVWEEPVEGLKVVPVGPTPPNPAEILSSPDFSEFLSGLRERFDYVLVDTSPIGLVADPAVLATQGDGVLLVLDAQKTRKAAVRRAIRDLKTVGVDILGTVMRNVNSPDGYYKDA